MPLEMDDLEGRRFNANGPYRRPIKIMGRRGPSNPSPDDEIDEYWIDDYWFYPEFFDIEIIGTNEKWGTKFIEGEMGALKRHLVQLTMMGADNVEINPFSILVCIENLQRYYKEKLKETVYDKEIIEKRLEECPKTTTISSTPESTTETQ